MAAYVWVKTIVNSMNRLIFNNGVFSYVKIHLHVQRNKLLSETKANNVEKK